MSCRSRTRVRASTPRKSNALAAACAALVIIVASGCGSDDDSAHVPALADAEGTYDATVQAPSSTSRPTVATVADLGFAVGIRFPAFDDGMAGALQPDGTIVGENGATARIEERSRTIRVTGVLASGVTFEMERPLGADARRFSDVYRFSLAISLSGCACPTTADISFDFPKNGNGQFGSFNADFEVDRNGHIVGDFDPHFFSPAALVSPRGKLVFVTSYRSDVFPDASRCASGGPSEEGDACTVTIEGTLPGADNGATVAKFVLESSDSVTLGTVEILRGPPPRPEPTAVE